MTASTSFNRTIVIIVAAATILLETMWDVLLDNLLIVTILSVEECSESRGLLIANFSEVLQKEKTIGEKEKAKTTDKRNKLISFSSCVISFSSCVIALLLTLTKNCKYGSL